MTPGRIHSFQSLGTVDGPGVRFVVFMQGCDLRCGCCHNPDTRELSGGKEFSPEEVLERILRCRSYFGDRGGVTLSGGEPLIQPEFCAGLFALCRREGINTCLDTAGFALTPSVREVLALTDRVLLDVKYSSEEKYLSFVGCKPERATDFLSELDRLCIPTTLRRVIIPTLNATPEETLALKELARAHKNVDGVELLPFRKLCQAKYDALGLEFPFAHLPTPTSREMDALRDLLDCPEK